MDHNFSTGEAAGDHAALFVIANPELAISEFFDRRTIRCLGDQRCCWLHGPLRKSEPVLSWLAPHHKDVSGLTIDKGINATAMPKPNHHSCR